MESRDEVRAISLLSPLPASKYDNSRPHQFFPIAATFVAQFFCFPQFFVGLFVQAEHRANLRLVGAECRALACLYDNRLPRWKFDDAFRAVFEELIKGLSGSRTERRAVVVTYDHAIRAHPIVEEGERVTCRLV